MTKISTFFLSLILFFHFPTWTEENPNFFELLETFNECDLEQSERHKAYNEYIVYVNEIMLTLAQEMKEMGLFLTGDSGSMHLKVEEVGVHFKAHHGATLEEARVLQVYIMNRLLKLINAHEKLRPFLKEYPFTHEEVEVGISFFNNNKRNSSDSIRYVFNVPGRNGYVQENRNHIFYSQEDPYKKERISDLKEHYFDAVKLTETSNLIYPYNHIFTEEERAIDLAFNGFLDENIGIWLECWGIGERKNKQEIIEEVGLNLKANGRFSQK